MDGICGRHLAVGLHIDEAMPVLAAVAIAVAIAIAIAVVAGSSSSAGCREGNRHRSHLLCHRGLGRMGEAPRSAMVLHPSRHHGSPPPNPSFLFG
jgi:hypothetical protein